jgi:exonuclease SbcC
LREAPVPPTLVEGASFQEATLDLAQRLEAHGAREQEAAAARRALDEARASRDAERTTRDQVLRGLDLARTAAQDAAGKAQLARADEAGLLDARQVLLDRLDTTFGDEVGWREAALADPGKLREACRERVRAWEENEARARRADEARQMAERELEGHRQAAQGAQVARAEAGAVLQKRGTEAEALRAERAALLEGRPAQTVEDELTQTVRAAESASSAAGEALRRASETRAEREARQQELLETSARLAQRQLEAERARDEQLREAELSIDEVQARLERPAAWIASEEATLGALRDEVTRMRAALATCEARTRKHQAVGVSSRDVAAAEAALVAARYDLTTAQDALGQVRYQLEEDQRARANLSTEVAELERLRSEARVWERLRDLIGSADGKKFRLYAQSLTLDALLSLANVHLQELRPRYRLERVPGEDALELQVIDRDMAHEVRSTQSLSGGETFLVSLALALALSSFASNKRLIRSLFIDEGFGTLDPQTLEDAIGTLDALQATGRQVGLISHVPGLGERLGVQVRITPVGGGRSEMRVLIS